MLWDLAEGKRLYSLDAGEIINALCFSPNRYWLCAATSQCIKARARARLSRLKRPVAFAAVGAMSAYRKRAESAWQQTCSLFCSSLCYIAPVYTRHQFMKSLTV